MPKPTHQPSKQTRDAVSLHAAIGTPQEHVARILGIDSKTLRKHYRDELDLGCSRANAAIAGQLYSKAMSGDTTSQIFWLKTRAGWKEKQDINHVSEDGSMTPKAAMTESEIRKEMERRGLPVPPLD